MWSLYEIIHIWTAVVDESEEWSSQLIFQFKQLEAYIILHFHLQPQFIYELFHINFTSFHSSREDMNSIKWSRS